MIKRSKKLTSLVFLSLPAFLWFGCNDCRTSCAVLYSEPMPSTIIASDMYQGPIQTVVCTTVNDPAMAAPRGNTVILSEQAMDQVLTASIPVNVNNAMAAAEPSQKLSATVPVSVNDRAKAMSRSASETSQPITATVAVNVADRAKATNGSSAETSQPISASVPVNISERSQPANASKLQNMQTTYASNNSSGRTSSRTMAAETFNQGDIQTIAPKNNYAQNSKANPSCEFATGVVVKARNPKMCLLGEQYSLDVEVTAYADVRDVVLSATLPDGVTFVSSQPEAKVSGRELTWNFNKLNKGQVVAGKIQLKTTKQGELCTNFTAKATSDGCCSIVCAKPVLTCEKTGPEEVCPGDQINYTVTVSNTGTYQAEDVVLALTDTIENKQNPNSFKLGVLEPGQSKKINFPVTATKRGKICYSAVATASNANQSSCDLCTLVTCYSIESSKKGPKEAIIGQQVNYQITVRNNGDRTLHDIVLTETAHPSTSIVAAEGADLSNKKAVWTVNELKAGDKATFNVTQTCRTTGNFTNNTAVASREGPRSANDYTTRWKGRAALDVSMSTSENSLCVGETSRYKISVTNQGQEPDSNVVIAVIFPAGLEPVTGTGAASAKIDGQTVSFAPYAVLAPRQTLEYFVSVKANVRGDLRPKVQVSSDSIKPPITQEESLIVN